MPDEFEGRLRDALRAEVARIPFRVETSAVQVRLAQTGRSSGWLMRFAAPVAAVMAVGALVLLLIIPGIDDDQEPAPGTGSSLVPQTRIPSRTPAAASPQPTPHPMDRVRAAWTAVENHLYVAGGAAGGALTSVAELDLDVGTWVDLPDLPEPRLDGAAAILPDGGLLVFGGLMGDEPTDTTLALDPDRQGWSRREPMPHPQADMAVAVRDGLVYLFGGRYPDQQDVLIYDPAADAWSSGEPIPAPVTHGAAATFDGAIYLFGGQSETQVVGHLAYRYDPTADRWEPLLDMPLAGASMSATVVGDRIWVIARDWVWIASTPDPAPDQRFGRVLVFDPGAGTWDVSPQRVNPGAGAHMAVPLEGGNIFVIVASPFSSTSNTIRTTEP